MIAQADFDRIKAEVLANIESLGGVCKRKQQKMIKQALRDFELQKSQPASAVAPHTRRTKGAYMHSDPTYLAAKVDRLVRADLVQVGARD